MQDNMKQTAKAVEHADKAVRYIEYNYMNETSPKDVSVYLFYSVNIQAAILLSSVHSFPADA